MSATALKGLGGILVTAVHKEGLLGGTDLPLMQEVSRRSRAPIQASGGITTTNELRALAAARVSAAILGMALYTGALDAETLREEFADGHRRS